MADDKIDAMMVTIVGAVLGVIMLCSFALPTIQTQIGTLTGDAATKYGATVGLVSLFLIIGLILFTIRRFNSAGR